MHFCQIFGLSKLLTGRENGSQKGITGREFGSQKGITGREFGSQNNLPEVNLALKYHYRKRIWLSNVFEIVKTQRNLIQVKATLKQLALELDIIAPCSPPTHPTTNFSATSRLARELKFGIDTH